MKPEELSTKEPITWCPGCPNFGILQGVKETIAKMVSSGKYKKKDFVITAGIGCHAKIFDYLNLSGVYGLHGRPVSVATGITLANPKLKVISFAGDGDTYSEGISHFIHAFRFNPDMTLLVHDNQSFSLTTGQATPTSQKGFVTKAEPFGEKNEPLNPLKLALASGATFIARTNALDIKHFSETLKKAIEHKGFAYVEVMQKCLIFNREMNDLDKLIYKIKDNENYETAKKLVEVWNYNSRTGKIPIGVIYQTRKPTLSEKFRR